MTELLALIHKYNGQVDWDLSEVKTYFVDFMTPESLSLCHEDIRRLHPTVSVDALRRGEGLPPRILRIKL